MGNQCGLCAPCVHGAATDPKETKVVPITRTALQDYADFLEEEKLLRMQELYEAMYDHGILASTLGSSEKITQACKKHHLTSFIDVDFFPNQAALFNNPLNSAAARIAWKRPTEMFKEVSLFGEDIRPLHVEQGSLGDCWFLAALQALAEFPDLIKNLFKTKEVNPIGVYEIQCFKDGQPTTVIVDDYLPCSLATGKLCYSRSKHWALWVPLLEKAWAKLHGSYEQIEAGLPYKALMDLTGAPGYTIRLDPHADWIVSGELFDELEAFHERGYIMAAGTNGNGVLSHSPAKLVSGLVPGHAYVLKRAKKANGIKLLELRNPWGCGAWQGAWAHRSAEWTQEMIRAFEPQFEGEGGAFWMCETDFVLHFDSVDVLHFRGHLGCPWAEFRTTIRTTGSDVCSQVVEFEVSHKSEGFISLVQKDSRVKGNPQYRRLSFGIYGPCGKNGVPAREVLRSENYDTGVCELVEELGSDSLLKPGKYLVVVYNPDRTANVESTLVVQLATKSDSGGPSGVPAVVREMEPRLRRAIAQVVATSSSSIVETRGPFKMTGRYLPHGGFALALQYTGQLAMTVTVDFTVCKHLELVDLPAHSKCVQVTCQAREDLRLVAELAPAGTGDPDVVYNLRWKG